jgi:hypothetical protein
MVSLQLNVLETCGWFPEGQAVQPVLMFGGRAWEQTHRHCSTTADLRKACWHGRIAVGGKESWHDYFNECFRYIASNESIYVIFMNLYFIVFS